MKTTAPKWTRVVLVTAVALAIATAPGAGFADTRAHADPARDVQQLDLASGAVTDVPDNHEADIVRVTITHTTKRVSEKFRVRMLPLRRWSFSSIVKTSGRNYLVHVGSGGVVAVRYLHGSGIKCQWSSIIDHVKQTVSWRLPRSCLKNPRWVRVASTMTWRPGSGPTMQIDADQAFAKGDAFDGQGHVLHNAFSGRVRP